MLASRWRLEEGRGKRMVTTNISKTGLMSSLDE